MKSKLLLSRDYQYHIVCHDRTVIHNAPLELVSTYLLKFKEKNFFNERSKKEIDDIDIAEINVKDSNMVAYVSDENNLVITNVLPLLFLLDNRDYNFIMNCVTTDEFAAMHNKAPVTIKKYCQNNLLRCKKIGKVWIIDATSPLPDDKRRKYK